MDPHFQMTTKPAKSKRRTAKERVLARHPHARALSPAAGPYVGQWLIDNGGFVFVGFAPTEVAAWADAASRLKTNKRKPT